MSKNTITSFEVIDHGVEHAQYFQGCGVSFTEFEHVATGCGSSAAEAYDDALEQIAQQGDVDFSTIEASEDHTRFTSQEACDATVEQSVEDNGGEDSELYYYVSVRYNLGFKIRILAPLVLLGTSVKFAADQIVPAIHATNQPDWEKRGLVFAFDADGNSMLIGKDGYALVTEGETVTA